jgi:peptidoglycan/LPS O-acetylase OafA/YrhL
VRPPTAPAARAFRADIEGLRAVAVGLVVLWHAGAPLLSGGFVGVDVFFVISGYLITTALAAEVAAHGRLSLRRFWARRAKRLLPSATLVLLAALLLSYLLLPDIRWPDTAADVLSSAGYLINWRLAAQSVDYLAAEQAPSIVQHYWSLAVEEQFYLLWPVLLTLVAWRVRRRGGPPGAFGRLATGTVLAVGAASLAWSVLMVQTEPGRAYFATTTRIWELAVGALLAWWPRRWPGGTAAGAAGWIGLAAVLGSAVTIDAATPFPGPAALPATLGTALVIAAGPAGRYGPAALLRQPPLQFLGGISYTLYLWHWPLLVALTARLEHPGVPARLAVVALAVGLAQLTSRYVERPIWHARGLASRPRAALAVGAACTVLTVSAALAFPVAAVPPARPGDAARPAGGIVPDPARARADLPSVYADGCHASQADTVVRTCAYGPPDATATVALVGDSHAAQWVPALQAVARARNWRLVTHTKSSCPVLDVEVALTVGAGRRPYDSCVRWNRALRRTLAEERPDLIVTSSYTYTAISHGRPLRGADNDRIMVAALRRTWTALATVAPVVVLRDTPAPGRDIADCVSGHRDRPESCAVPRAEALAGIGPLQVTAAAGLPGVRLVDLTDTVCPAARCAPVIGGVLVYRDAHHLTATYAGTLAPRLDALLPALPPRAG